MPKVLEGRGDSVSLSVAWPVKPQFPTDWFAMFVEVHREEQRSERGIALSAAGLSSVRLVSASVVREWRAGRVDARRGAEPM